MRSFLLGINAYLYLFTSSFCESICWLIVFHCLSVSTLETTLVNVDALRELRTDLHSRKMVSLIFANPLYSDLTLLIGNPAC